MRFSRDKRGYENTFLVHTHAVGGRRRGKARSRVLYWFRTPPGVRIGRSALDEDAIRLIEQHNPDVEFDWTRILKANEPPAEARIPQTDRRNRPRPREGQPRQSGPPAMSIPSVPPPVVQEDSVELEISSEAVSVERQPDEGAEYVVRSEPPETEMIEEFLAEPRVELASERPLPGDAISAVETRLGSEGLSRLRARYSEVMARISETVTDPVRHEELKSQAERLNPDTWVTDAEVTAGLESYETVFESLRTVVGRRRRRRRRSSGGPPGGDSQAVSAEISETPPEHEGTGEGEDTDGLDPPEQ